MKRWRPIFVVFAVLVFSGCDGPAEPLHPPGGPPVVGGVPLQPFRNTGKKDPRDFLLMVRLSLITVQVPVGSVSDSEQLFSYLDEEPVGARVGSALACNGIRVGVGRKGAWGEVAAILQRLTGRPLIRATLLSSPGTPMPIIFKPDQQAQTIFTYRRDGSLFGRDYPPGDNVLMTTATINYDDPSAVHIAATMIIRSVHRRRRYIKRSGRYAFISEPIYYRLDDLGFRFKIPHGDFLLIGPGLEARRRSSPGRHFLIHERKGLEFETVVIIAPEVFAAPVKKPE